MLIEDIEVGVADGIIDEVDLDLDLDLVIVDEIIPVLFQEIVVDDHILILILVREIIVDDIVLVQEMVVKFFFFH